MTTFVRQHPLFAFYTAALVIASLTVWPIFGNPTLISDFLRWERQAGVSSSILEPALFTIARARPLALVIYVFAAAPTISALAVAALAGWPALSKLIRHLRLFRRTFPVLAAVGAVVVCGALVLLMGSPPADRIPGVISPLTGPRWQLALDCLLLSLLDIGALSEELGWRGFALQRMLDRGRVSSLSAAVLIGALWAIWHVPRDVVIGLGHQGLGDFLGHEAVFISTCVFVSIVCVCACNLGGGSIWPAVLIHGGGNVWAALAGARFGDGWSQVYLGAMFILALACAGIWGRRLGSDRRLE